MASTAGMQSPPPAHAQQLQYAAYLSGAQQQLYQQAAASVRPGTLPPGVCVKIGEHEVTIERFLSEGGFAHVYVVRSSRPIPSPSGSSEVLHVLKRVAVPDKPTLKEVRWEVDVMKLLRGHKHIVNLIEASAAPIPGTPGYEVFILMEYCAGGGIIDMMNTRLQNRLTEAEVLKIFADVVEAVCWMHTRSPPLMHRDLKVENILLAGPDFYKVCDFGSATTPKRAPQSMQEIQALEAELNKTTTLQYRAPEMCDVWSRKEVGLPADIWALGVLLYKLCFYTTPFEEQGPLAILNVQYKMPSYPNYSQDLRKLIASMLVEPIHQRPTAWQVHQQVCRLMGTKPNKEYEQHKTLDVHHSPSHASLNGAVSPSFSSRPTSSMGAVVTNPNDPHHHPVSTTPQEQPGVSPMRRGRPGKSGQSQSISQPSNLHSEWHVPSSSSSSPPNESTGTPHPPIPGSHNPYVSHDGGFADSFAPSIPAITGTSMSSERDSSSSGQPLSKTASATAALFEELSNPGSTVKQAPTLAGLAAARSGGGKSAPLPSTGTSQRVQQYMQNFAGPSTRPPIANQDLRRVSPGKPLGPRPALPSPSASGNPPSRTPSYGSRPSLPVEEGTQTENPVTVPPVVPPVKPPKPNLVSRSSQTSPTLLNEWKQKEQEAIRRHLPSRTTSLKSNASHTDSHGQTVEQTNLERFPSIDDWESTGFSPSSEASVATFASHKTSASAARQQPVDLLGDLEETHGHAPSRATTYPTAGAGREPTRHISTGSLGSAPSHSLQPTSAPPLPSASPAQGISAVESSSSSDSEDEEGPEEPTGHHYGTSTPPAPAHSALHTVAPAQPLSNTSETSQRSPARAPPILAPKPKLGGISSIVSRYESISASDPPSISRQPSDTSTSGMLKPVKPPKPNFTGTTRQNSLDSTQSLPNSTSAESFNARYPNIAVEKHSHSMPDPRDNIEPNGTQSSHPSFSSDKYRSRESREEIKFGRPRPQSMHFAASPAGDSVQASHSENINYHKHQQSQISEEAEEEYQGVANLRERWQKMHAGSTGQQQDGLNRRATLGSNRWSRA